jgi:hypothetical protein
MSNGRFYNHLDTAEVRAHLDAGETLFFSRDLERIETEFYDVKYPELKGRQFCPLGTGLSPADLYNTWRQFDRKGGAIEGGMESDDIPIVSLVGQEFHSRVVPLIVGFEYTIQDIRAAAKQQRPLDSMLAMAARKAVEEAIERMVAVGSVDVSKNLVYGLLNQPNVPLISSAGASVAGYPTLATGASGGTYWTSPQNVSASGKTPKEIIRDLNSWRNAVQLNTNGVEDVDSLILDLNSYNYIDTTQVNDADSAIFTQGTIKSYIMNNLSWLKSIEPWLQCGTSSTNPGPGTQGTAKARSMLYKKDPHNFKMFIPQEFEMFPPQLLNFKFKVPCHARFGGVVNYYPRSCVYIDGLQP